MTRMKNVLAAAAALSLSANATAGVPHAAAAASFDTDFARPGMFAGATYRLTLDRGTQRPSGRASLTVAGMLRSPQSHQLRFGQGIELVAGKTGKPTLHIGGTELRELEDKMALSGGAKTALIVAGGLVLLVGALFVIGGNEAVDDINDDGGLDW